jgi:hypothetical protein
MKKFAFLFFCFLVCVSAYPRGSFALLGEYYKQDLDAKEDEGFFGEVITFVPKEADWLPTLGFVDFDFLSVDGVPGIFEVLQLVVAGEGIEPLLCGKLIILLLRSNKFLIFKHEPPIVELHDEHGMKWVRVPCTIDSFHSQEEIGTGIGSSKEDEELTFPNRFYNNLREFGSIFFLVPLGLRELQLQRKQTDLLFLSLYFVYVLYGFFG